MFYTICVYSYVEVFWFDLLVAMYNVIVYLFYCLTIETNNVTYITLTKYQSVLKVQSPSICVKNLIMFVTICNPH